MPYLNRTERFLSLFTIVLPEEGRAALRLCLLSFVLMVAYYLLKVIREPLILAEGSAELKAYSTAVQALLLMLIIPPFTRLYQRMEKREKKHHLFHLTLVSFIPMLAGFALAYQLGLPIGIIFYIWLGIFSVMVLALFWAFATDLLNPRTGQRLFPVIAAAASLGALLGAGIAGTLDQVIGHGGVMWLAAGLLIIPVLLAGKIENTIPAGSRSFDAEDHLPQLSLIEGFQIIFRSRYLILIMIFVVVLNLANTNGEYILTSLVTQTAAETAPNVDLFITRFYAGYIFLIALLSFLVQLFLVSRIYSLIGIHGALYVLPLLMLLSYSLLALAPLLLVARYVMTAENSINYSLQTTTRHALFLPVRRVEKYLAKHTIDTFFFRLGDVISGGLIYLGSTMIGLSLLGFVQLNIALSAVLLGLAVHIGREYRSAVRENIKNSPPRVATPIDDLSIPAGQLTRFQIEADTFIDPDHGDALRYEASTSNLDALPVWAKFDALNRHFEFNPPQLASGSLNIRVVATDYQGLRAELIFRVDYGTRG